MRRLGLVVCLCAAVLPLRPAHGADKIVMQLRWDHQFQFAGYYAALWQGYYAAVGLDVELRSAFGRDGKYRDVTNEVATGRAQFGTGGADILETRDKGAPLVVLASIFQHSPVAFYAKRGTGMRHPADLTHLRVATRGPEGIVSVELRAMLRAENIDPALVHEQKIVSQLGMQDLQRGLADVVAGFTISEEYYARVLGLDVVSLHPADYGVDFYGSALFARRDWVLHHIDTTERFVAASLKGWSYALEHSEKVADRIAATMPRQVPLRDARAFNRAQIAPVRALIQYPIIGLGHSNPARWRLMYKALADAGLVHRGLDENDLIFDQTRFDRIKAEQFKHFIYIVIGLLILIAAAGLAAAVRGRIRGRETARAQARLNEARFRDFAAAVADFFWETDASLTITFVSLPAARDVLERALDGGHGDAAGLNIEGPEKLHACLEARTPFRNIVVTHADPARGRLYHALSGVPCFDIDGKFQGFRGTGTDVSYRTELESTLATITKGLLRVTGEDYLRSLALHLGHALAADYVFVGEIKDGEAARVQTLVAAADGKIIDNFEYDTANTPCQSVFSKAVCVYPHGVRELFPADAMLQTERLESYAEAPLLDSDGQVLGNLVVMSRMALHNPAMVEALISVFATRAAAEIERVRSEHVRMEQARLLELALDNLGQGYCIFDKDGRLVAFNSSFVALQELDRNFVRIGRTFEEIARHQYERHARTDAEIESYIALRTRNMRREFDHGTIVLPSGRTLIASRRSMPDGGMVSTYVDVTATRRAEQERLELEARVLQSEKLSTIGTLAGGIAHDFNNVLTPILGYTKLLLKRFPQGTPEGQRLERILRAANRASEMIARIMSFSRKSEAQPGPVHLQEVLAESLDLLHVALPRNIEVREHIDSNGPPVMGDLTQIQQIILNICTNALHAMQAGEGNLGVLGVSLGAITIAREKADNLGLPSAGDYLCLAISDTGTGMDAETLGHVFDPFFTTKGAGQGTGLGLATAMSIATRYGGTITAESVPGSGSTFTMYLPVAGSIERQPMAGPPSPTGDRPHHILVVDDEPQIRDVMEEALTELGYDVTLACNGNEALGLFQADPAGFDAIVTDNNMPGMGGALLAERIRDIRADVPIVMTTGFDLGAMPEQARRLGIREIIAKPVGVEQLDRALRRALAAEADIAARPAS